MFLKSGSVKYLLVVFLAVVVVSLLLVRREGFSPGQPIPPGRPIPPLLPRCKTDNDCKGGHVCYGHMSRCIPAGGMRKDAPCGRDGVCKFGCDMAAKKCL